MIYDNYKTDEERVKVAEHVDFLTLHIWSEEAKTPETKRELEYWSNRKYHQEND